MSTDSRTVIPRREPDAPVRVVIGWHMPFVGVRYYKLLTEVDIALKRDRIGPVGWRSEPAIGEARSALVRDAELVAT